MRLRLMLRGGHVVEGDWAGMPGQREGTPFHQVLRHPETLQLFTDPTAIMLIFSTEVGGGVTSVVVRNICAVEELP